ncbi:MAG: ATP-binding cassette domain-containing protein [Chloroflexi bacterium]|nr:ATP-binding cassette domain-containing protein [Chloroflexota bacterium]
MIEFRNLTKTYGPTRAVDDVSFSAPPGAVTGFLGPNGAGKTTTLRVLLGLARPDSGSALINGVSYGELPSPRQAIGAVLDAIGIHPGRSGRNHLNVIARAAGLPERRVDEMLELVDLTAAADRKAGGYSQGMKQRLRLAGALLGDPGVLVLDEPANGLDPVGMAWLRQLLTGWAAQGRTVLFSSHVLAEVELVADRFVIINRGRVVREETAAELRGQGTGVTVATPEAVRLTELARQQGWRVEPSRGDRLVIHGASSIEVGQAAARAGLVLSELSAQAPAGQLEGMFLELTAAGAAR